MKNITKDEVYNYCVSGEFTVAATLSADSDSKAAKSSKNVHLTFMLENTPLSEIMTPALANKRITWQTGARSKFESIVNGSTIKVAFKGGQLPVDPIGAVVEKMQRMTAEEQAAFIAQLMAKASVKQV